MLSRAIAPTARLVAARPLRVVPAVPILLSRSPVLASLVAPSFHRTYAGQPDRSSSHEGAPVTSTSHPTVPRTPPKPTPFFARKNIGLEVTPLMAFIGTIVTVAIGFMVHALMTDNTIQHRHGVPEDDELKKAIGKK
ncbi:hypothetical protein NBRC10512_007894 [Rhodotorula toruloides]|uniref:RHTO0S04e04500g1_1 n=2 Tax=Rhodotorula toruloides TaxID=5286 RepID=A0A061AP95_RHOTO|nr:uncharacterized protein RHTO_01952 [Rhodotorula toruloides NP11]EMS21082.1 hypothetical protein RHTO_01952 [Rhodotorula toruloides NP11]CDR39377.1 RHTO0S04e04500g1_1 [Rhodotorula toruloides]